MKNWALYHTHSGHIEYFETEEEAESTRASFYNEHQADIPEKDEDYETFYDYSEFCEFWKIEQIQE